MEEKIVNSTKTQEQFDSGIGAILALFVGVSVVCFVAAMGLVNYVHSISVETRQVSATVAGKGDIEKFNAKDAALAGTFATVATALLGGSKTVVAVNGISSTVTTGLLTAEGCRMPVVADGSLRLVKAPESVCKTQVQAGAPVTIKKMAKYRTEDGRKTLLDTWYEW